MGITVNERPPSTPRPQTEPVGQGGSSPREENK